MKRGNRRNNATTSLEARLRRTEADLKAAELARELWRERCERAEAAVEPLHTMLEHARREGFGVIMADALQDPTW